MFMSQPQFLTNLHFFFFFCFQAPEPGKSGDFINEGQTIEVLNLRRLKSKIIFMVAI